MKIVSFELENVKRVALVRLAPSENGLTVIGGDNCQGKTSILDGIVYALGGEKYRPENLQREGGMAPARIRIEMTGGLVVERKGKNASLHVTDPSGRKAGQKLLDSFIEELALNLPKFLAMRDDDKAEVLLRTLGIEDALHDLDLREKVAYDRRHDFGVIVDQKRKFANGLTEYPDVPDTPVSPAEMVAESEAIIRRNAERAQARAALVALKDEMESNTEKCSEFTDMIKRLQDQRHVLLDRNQEIERRLQEASENPISEDESTDELKARIEQIDDVNAKIRANLDKANAIAEAEEYERKLGGYTAELEKVREERRNLLKGAGMPLPELSIGANDKGRPVLLYNGHPWSDMSGMERIRVGTAIVRKLKPDCGFVLLDGMEAFDMQQLEVFDQWLKNEGLQAICTRVGKEGSTIVIEDGVAVDESVEPPPEVPGEDAPIPMERTAEQEQEMDW